MFERFTDRARRVVVLAQEEARMLNHNYIGTEHILLGLIHEGEGVAAKALESLGISLEAVRQQVEEIIGQGSGNGGHPFTPWAKRSGAPGREHRPGHNYVGTEHRRWVWSGRARCRPGGLKLGADLAGAAAGGPPATWPLERRAQQGPAGAAAAPGCLTPWRGSIAGPAAGSHQRWAGLRPDLAGLDEEIAQVRRGKESAIDAQDFETAAALRDKEKDLLTSKASREREWTADAADRLSLAGEIGRVNAELERLRAVLREHGIEPGNGAA